MKRFLCAGEAYALSKPKLNSHLVLAIRISHRQNGLIAIFLSLLSLFIQVAQANDTAPAPTGRAVFSTETVHTSFPLFQQQQQTVLTGTVVDQEGQPLEGVTIAVRGTTVTTSSDAEGRFVLTAPAASGVLLVSFLGHEPLTQRFDAEDAGPFNFVLTPADARLEEVEVSTGYQQLQRKHITGSVDFVDNELFNRRVGGSVLERLENITTGLSYDTPRERTPDNPSGILIRGRNSIYSNVAPLIILDNFPYDGDIENINPNDVESVTILKDAAAAAQWGARAGNGVIVITTKRGIGSRPAVSVMANTTHQDRPDLYAIPTISASDYIDLERFHFEEGYYNNHLLATRNPPPLTPVVELLAKQRDGLVDPAAVEAQISEWKTKDVRDDLTRYFYQPMLRQQYALNVSGRSPVLDYYFSTGYDAERPHLVGGDSRRVTLRSRNVYTVTEGLDVGIGITYANNGRSSGTNTGWNTRSGSKSMYPYADLVDEDGKALPIARDYRTGFLEKLVSDNDKLQDWLYRPYDEISAVDNRHETNDLLLNTDVNYRFFRDFQLSLRYQFQNLRGQSHLLDGPDSYDARSTSNQFYQPGAAIEFPVPQSGIMVESGRSVTSHQGRVQLDYHRTFSGLHDLRAIAGWEIKDVERRESMMRHYGYSRVGSTVEPNMDFVTRYPRFQDPASLAIIPNLHMFSETADRFLSSYINAVYTFDGRLSVSGSMREDAANLFGVQTNRRGVPLWSVGSAWNLHNEAFIRGLGLSLFRLRTSYGSSGNFSRRATAFTTLSYHTNLGVHAADISNPPNAHLRWEQNRQFNLALEAADRRAGLGFTVEYFRKHNKDLMAEAPIDPTLGILTGQASTFYGNVASTKGEGIEGQLNFISDNPHWNWRVNARFTYVSTYVSEYLLDPPTTSSRYTGAIINPLVGKPVYSMYSHRWGGLDPETGDPRGYWEGELSKNYSDIVNQTSPDSLIYHGSLQAPIFGGLTLGMNWKMIGISADIAYAFGHYFRAQSLESVSIVDAWSGHGDYARRWQKPGDEEHTDVPSFVYRPPGNRDNFYRNSEARVLPASYLTLRDIRVDVDLGRPFRGLFTGARLFAYLSDLDLIWVGNSPGLNPLRMGVPKSAMSISFGLNLNL